MSEHRTALQSEDSSLFHDAFWRSASFFPSDVAIVAGTNAEGARFGFTVSSLTIVSARPALVSICVHRESRYVESLREEARFSINVLRETQVELAQRFAAPGADRFGETLWRLHEADCPIFEDVLAALLCQVRSVIEAGDHCLVIAEVKDLALNGGKPLVYWRRAFHRLFVEYTFLQDVAALEDFMRRWKSGTLPKPAWTHGAHVAMAAYFAFDYPADEAFELTKAGILHFNACVGTPNTEHSGYHETLTRLWSHVVGDFVRKGRFESRLDAVRGAVGRFGEDRDRHRLYYSFDVVRDPAARRSWVPPDRNAPTAYCGGAAAPGPQSHSV